MPGLLCDFCSSDRRFARGLVGSPHPASFRFHLTMDTLAFGYILPTTGRIRDLHPLETCAAGRTNRRAGRRIFFVIRRPARFLLIFSLSQLFYCFESQTVLVRSHKDIVSVLTITANEHFRHSCLNVLLQITLDRSRTVMRIVESLLRYRTSHPPTA